MFCESDWLQLLKWHSQMVGEVDKRKCGKTHCSKMGTHHGTFGQSSPGQRQMKRSRWSHSIKKRLIGDDNLFILVETYYRKKLDVLPSKMFTFMLIWHFSLTLKSPCLLIPYIITSGPGATYSSGAGRVEGTWTCIIWGKYFIIYYKSLGYTLNKYCYVLVYTLKLNYISFLQIYKLILLYVY